jgi:hypothetical protein
VSLSKDGYDGRVLGKPELVQRTAGDGGVLVHRHLHQGDLPALQLEQPHQVAGGDRLLHERGEDVGRAHRDVHPPLVREQPLVLGVIDPGDHPGNPVLLLRQQRGHQVVLVVAGCRHHDVGGSEVRLVQDPGLAGVAEHEVDSRGGVLANLLQDVRLLLDHGDLVSPFVEVRRQVPPHVPGARDHDPHLLSLIPPAAP